MAESLRLGIQWKWPRVRRISAGWQSSPGGDLDSFFSRRRYSARVSELSLSYSIADQSFAQTQSIGILNLSVQMLEFLARRPEIRRLNVLSNSSLSDRLKLPPEVPVTLHDSALRNLTGRVAWDQWGAYAQGKRLGNK